MKLHYLLGLVMASGALMACQGESTKTNTEAVTESSTTTESKIIPDTTRITQLTIDAPVAAQKASSREYHGKTLSDPYLWLKDPDYPKTDDEDVLDYLKAENAYYQEFLKPHKPLVDTVFEEFKGRTDETEESVPYIDNGYEYRWYYKEGAEYRTRARKNLKTGDEAVFFDVSTKPCWPKDMSIS